MHRVEAQLAMHDGLTPRLPPCDDGSEPIGVDPRKFSYVVLLLEMSEQWKHERPRGNHTRKPAINAIANARGASPTASSIVPARVVGVQLPPRFVKLLCVPSFTITAMQPAIVQST